MRKLFGTDGIRGVTFIFKNEKRRHPGTESLIRGRVEGGKAKESGELTAAFRRFLCPNSQ